MICDIMHVVKITDGLGNQMFQYAFARKLQIVTGKQVYLDTRFVNHEDKKEKRKASWFVNQCGDREYGLDNFRIRLLRADDTKLRKWAYLQQNNDIQYLLFYLSKNNMWFSRYVNEADFSSKGLLNSIHCPTYCEGYYFDLGLYDDIREILKKDFCLARSMKLPRVLKTVLKQNNTVSLHIRKGDFSKIARDISQSEYYVKALELIKERVSNPYYLVFSDDIQWVKNNIGINVPHMYVSELGFEDYQELTIMKHCKHNIIANSTFSYWAAYLNDNKQKIVISPKGWKNKIIPDDWIKI